jgi:hypothetical protein
MAIPEPARERASAFLSAIDEARPGLVTGLYLIGSIAYGDFQPGVSDVDFMAVTATTPTEADRTALRSAHAAVTALGEPVFEGQYVTAEQLRCAPAGPRLHFHGGRLQTGGRYSPVEWVSLANDGIAVRGPEPAAIGVATDPVELAAWTRNNLNTYWRTWQQRCRKPIGRTALVALTDSGIAWAVLGIARMHYTLATGKITSKSGGGRFALEHYEDRWHPIVTEALRCRSVPLRRPSSLPGAIRRRRQCADFMAEVLRRVMVGEP